MIFSKQALSKETRQLMRMMKNLNRLIHNRNFLLMLLLVLSFSLWIFVKPELKVKRTDLGDQQSLEYMKQAYVTVFTDEGKIKNELFASAWLYHPKNQSSTLTTPHLTFYKPDGSEWTIDAKEGTIAQPTLGSIEKITLQNQVILQRLASKTLTPLKMETESLNYQPKKQYADSDKLVTLIKPGLKITGIGLRAFLDQNSVELLRDVKTQYLPNE